MHTRLGGDIVCGEESTGMESEMVVRCDCGLMGRVSMHRVGCDSLSLQVAHGSARIWSSSRPNRRWSRPLAGGLEREPVPREPGPLRSAVNIQRLHVGHASSTGAISAFPPFPRMGRAHRTVRSLPGDPSTGAGARALRFFRSAPVSRKPLRGCLETYATWATASRRVMMLIMAR
jgi:hypothetical protein